MSVMSNVGGGGNVNVRYDDSTDYVQIKYNGTWTNWKKAYLQFDGTIYDNGTWAVDYDNTGYILTTGYTTLGGATLGVSSFSFPNTPTSNANDYVILTDDTIDVTDWNVLYLIYNSSTYSIDVSLLSGSYYIYVTAYKSSAGNYGFRFGLTTTKQYFNDNNVGMNSIVNDSSTASDIKYAVTKIWLAMS